jgi:hypothetical protein
MNYQIQKDPILINLIKYILYILYKKGPHMRITDENDYYPFTFSPLLFSITLSKTKGNNRYCHCIISC